ncbi:MAG: LysM peptidoglycan-binding domain-containing protein, partial [Mariprofundaceae bacterium]|nr:LysM peptidoglycan-binding domain-containing protein [Mariprofundaceae bacterium]
VPNETRNYVIRILGVTALLHLHILRFPKEIHTIKVTLNAPVDISILEKKLALPKNYLFKLNPQLHYSQYFHGSVTLHIPLHLQDRLLKVQQQYRPHYIHVRIRSGDSLWRLAKHYHTTITHLKHLNPHLAKTLHLGHRIKVPAHGYGRATARLNPLLSGGRRIHYKVRKGDSLWSISRRFGTSTHAISRSNQLSKHHILRPGDTLWILARIRSS